MDTESLQAHDNVHPLRQEEESKGDREKDSETYPLPLEDYKRYGRQMILDGFGLQGQVNLSHASIAVVGAGGLGCPVLQYLAAAGVGKLGIFDADTVDISNLQRQILHSEVTLGMPKALSAKEALLRINSRLNIEAVTEAITAPNALSLLRAYSLILDCTDNVPTRYLLSDVAVTLGVPLVSGAAQRLDGQLCVYNMVQGEGVRGPCYRCIFPTPPNPTTVGSCEELGVLGGVTGVIGSLQAVEAVKILTGMDQRPTMTIYNALSFPPFRSIRLRPRREACIACGKDATERRARERAEGLEVTLPAVDYVQFCGGPTPDWEREGQVSGQEGERMRAGDLKQLLDNGEQVNIIDVRNPTEFSIVHLPSSRNVPLKTLLASPSSYLSAHPTVVTCRLGNDSKIGADALRKALVEERVTDGLAGEEPKAAERTLEGKGRPAEGSGADVEGIGQAGAPLGERGPVMDLVGGLRAWSFQVDSTFPQY
ncbi:hypothetical protein FA13DRAFT_1481490 [Coprinellus micaceus]|uniref:Rhodanese domain-containing protein n=1 Tax=Coprinellus micaceus TaxID=71717 RepID=A0A4Y7TLP8_COPMI|nr:hypothetical protein FA13DRAFT_1481490 [Coprinellus micaceus]